MKHSDKCPTCGRFVQDDADGYYDVAPGGLRGRDLVACYCSEDCADRKSPPARDEAEPMKDGEAYRLDLLALRSAFGREFLALDAGGRRLLVADLREVVREERMPPPSAAREMARRVGRGNLASYADCLKAGAARRAAQAGRPEEPK